MAASGNRLVAVDGLRGIAALAVVLMHAHLDWIPMPRGYLAVDFFFILSGYVIARRYEPRFASGLALRDYAWLRIERLYPLVAIGGLLGVAVWLTGLAPFRPASQADLLRALIGQLFLVPYLSSAPSLAFNPALWSISYELLANTLHALLCPRLDNRRLLALLAVAFAGLVLAAHHFGSLDVGHHLASAPGGLVRVSFGFLLGVLLHRTEARWGPGLPSLPFAIIGLALAAVVAAPLRSHGLGNAGMLYDLAMAALVLPLLVMLGTKAHGAGPVAGFLGVLSFPIYAVHVPLVDGMRLAGWSNGSRLAGVGLIAVLAWALGRCLDSPLAARRRAGCQPAPATTVQAPPPAGHGRVADC